MSHSIQEAFVFYRSQWLQYLASWPVFVMVPLVVEVWHSHIDIHGHLDIDNLDSHWINYDSETIWSF